jgi:peptide/nickel transport system substrate-binding protein
VPVAPLAAVLAALPALAAAAARPAYGGEVVVALPASPREPDPARAADPAELLAARALHATPLEIDAAGALSPGLLAEVPVPEAGGRTFRLRLREGLRFADGSPLTARHLAGSLSRLAAPGAPNGWIVLPVAGAGALDGSEAAGIQVLSDREVRIDLDLALPEFPWALAALPAAVVSPRGVGAGPFRPAGSLAPHDGRLLLAANEAHHRGRPFADRAVLLVRPPRGLAEEVARGDVHLALRAEALSPGAVPLRPAVATYAAVNGRTLGALAVRVRSALAAIDRAELVRRFVRGPSEPLAALLPPWQHAAGGGGGAGPPAAPRPRGAGERERRGARPPHPDPLPRRAGEREGSGPAPSSSSSPPAPRTHAPPPTGSR